MSTIWAIGQYFGWVEILRREVQYLDLGSRAVNRRLQLRLSDISTAFASDSHRDENAFVIFRADQRAVGEFMVTTRETETGTKRSDCLGYSEFLERIQKATIASELETGPWRSPIVGWAARCQADLRNATGQPETAMRLTRIQRRLIDLVDLLDPDRVRYPETNYRGRLPFTGAADPPMSRRVPQFLWRTSDPWLMIERWARANRFRAESDSRHTRVYIGALGPSLHRPQVLIECDGAWVTLDASMVRSTKRRAIDGTLRATRGRAAVNKLLSAFDRPTIADGSTVPSRAARGAMRLVRRLGAAGEEQGS